jgi:recombination protein RecA
MTGGGIPVGRMIEVFGTPGVGKTTLAFAIARAMQKHGSILFLDFEEALDEQYMADCGVDMSKIDILEPDYLEQGCDAILSALDKNRPHYSLVVIDSVSEMTPKAELYDKKGKPQSMEKDTIGLQARLVTQFCRLVGKRLKRAKSAIIGINQARVAIGSYGDPVTTSGGAAFKHKAAIRIYCTGGKSKKIDGGVTLRLWQKKNKVARTIRDAVTFEIERGRGINIDYDLIELALAAGILTKKGGGNYAIGSKVFKGRLAAVEALKGSKAFNEFLETGAVEDA